MSILLFVQTGKCHWEGDADIYTLLLLLLLSRLSRVRLCAIP